MPRRPHIRQCNKCGQVYPGSTEACPGCGISLIKRRFKMTPKRIQRVHVVAHKQKGLSRQEYEDVLAGIGVASCKDMKEKHYNDFFKRMRQLPDALAMDGRVPRRQDAESGVHHKQKVAA